MVSSSLQDIKVLLFTFGLIPISLPSLALAMYNDRGDVKHGSITTPLLSNSKQVNVNDTECWEFGDLKLLARKLKGLKKSVVKDEKQFEFLKSTDENVLQDLLQTIESELVPTRPHCFFKRTGRMVEKPVKPIDPEILTLARFTVVGASSKVTLTEDQTVLFYNAVIILTLNHATNDLLKKLEKPTADQLAEISKMRSFARYVHKTVFAPLEKKDPHVVNAALKQGRKLIKTYCKGYEKIERNNQQQAMLEKIFFLLYDELLSPAESKTNSNAEKVALKRILKRFPPVLYLDLPAMEINSSVKDPGTSPYIAFHRCLMRLHDYNIKHQMPRNLRIENEYWERLLCGNSNAASNPNPDGNGDYSALSAENFPESQGLEK